MSRTAIDGARIFDGETFHQDHALLLEGDRIAGLCRAGEIPSDAEVVKADGLTIAPGFIDLQVNGGGGVLFNNDPTVGGIARICAAHAQYGTTSLLVTLITDTPELTATAIAAGVESQSVHVPGYLGLHIEGPHLSLARKGTHDPALIRPMAPEDLERLRAAGGRFGEALITVAPESVTPGQVRALVAAGYKVSLGHTDSTAQTVLAYVEAGASLVTHLFNAMSQLGNREPGVVGAALSSGALSCGLIADGFHVDPISMSVALKAKQGPGRIFLVTDSMSTIGSDDDGLVLNGRQVYRGGGRLTLADGTLAGADIDMLSCVRNAHHMLGLDLGEALRMASLYPADAIGARHKGRIAVGCDADFVMLGPDLTLHSTYIAGKRVFGTSPQKERAS
ncbi:N-acetylglucosamine-6-phosphate deacetylase [Rhizobium halophytocola]|uniref:N-acetylglucosamine-6-phosphate deacetylase n=1 Tax=Rhizobium halophytocola TaxID=735519 RepID=A0ABS4E4Z0_9HYPH|nr:N-acetylglucosamine-6-phosphate deacetylase [Rhizobium halophytocola]MBP1853019.1 N-acetylglucosamine-6-phosphate deacetylase [Rhizobium halophytocola]